MKNLCIVTGFNKAYHDIANITIPNFVEYCNIHNIDLHISTKSYVDEKHNWGWNKYGIISNIINNYDWIAWVDIDCLFINKNKDLRNLIDDNYSLVIGENRRPPDWYTEDISYVENGVFLLRNDSLGKEMLKDFSSEIIEHPWHDQYKMIKCLKNNQFYNEKTKRVYYMDINAIDYHIDCFSVKKEDVFIYHVAGGSSVPFNRKIELLKKYKN